MIYHDAFESLRPGGVQEVFQKIGLLHLAIVVIFRVAVKYKIAPMYNDYNNNNSTVFRRVFTFVLHTHTLIIG